MANVHHYVEPKIHHDPVADAHTLEKAMKGLGTNEKLIISVVCHRNPVEIQAIKEAFAKDIKKDLTKELHSEVSGHFREVIEGILRGPAGWYADALHHTVAGLGTDEDTLFEILVGQNKHNLDIISHVYEQTYHKTLKHVIEGDLSGDLLNLAVHLIAGRDPEVHVNLDAAKADAERLYNAGEAKLGTDEKTIIEIFTRRSYSHLFEVLKAYEAVHTHHSVYEAVQKEFSGHLQRALLGIVTYAQNPADFFAQHIRKAVEGAGTNDKKLIRIIVGQYDRLASIKDAYSKRYQRSLYETLESETSGDYKAALLALLDNQAL